MWNFRVLGRDLFSCFDRAGELMPWADVRIGVTCYSCVRGYGIIPAKTSAGLWFAA